MGSLAIKCGLKQAYSTKVITVVACSSINVADISEWFPWYKISDQISTKATDNQPSSLLCRLTPDVALLHKAILHPVIQDETMHRPNV